jgi:hypothetical protein
MSRKEAAALAAIRRSELRIKWIEIIKSEMASGESSKDALVAAARDMLDLQKKNPSGASEVGRAWTEFRIQIKSSVARGPSEMGTNSDLGSAVS